jgi:hypothetical protein
MCSIRTKTILLRKSFIFIYFCEVLIFLLFKEDNSGIRILVSLLQRKQYLAGILIQAKI